MRDGGCVHSVDRDRDRGRAKRWWSSSAIHISFALMLPDVVVRGKKKDVHYDSYELELLEVVIRVNKK